MLCQHVQLGPDRVTSRWRLSGGSLDSARMPLFKVALQGHGLWIEIDSKVQRVGFRVTRVVESDDSEGAAEKALDLIRSDPKAHHLPGKPPPTLSVDTVLRAASAPAVNPGFMFFPDPESPAV